MVGNRPGLGTVDPVVRHSASSRSDGGGPCVRQSQPGVASLTVGSMVGEGVLWSDVLAVSLSLGSSLLCLIRFGAC